MTRNSSEKQWLRQFRHSRIHTSSANWRNNRHENKKKRKEVSFDTLCRILDDFSTERTYSLHTLLSFCLSSRYFLEQLKMCSHPLSLHCTRMCAYITGSCQSFSSWNFENVIAKQPNSSCIHSKALTYIWAPNTPNKYNSLVSSWGRVDQVYGGARETCTIVRAYNALATSRNKRKNRGI